MALSIAGVDSSGGAGLVADVRTFTAYGAWPAVAVTSVTAQNTLGVQLAEPMTPELVRAQIASVASDLGVDGAKTGMLATAGVIESVAYTVGELGVSPLILDPVLVSSQGDALLGAGGVDALRKLLLPLAAVVTPNLAEAAVLADVEVQSVDSRAAMAEVARAILDLGPAAVMVTGGHLVDGELAADCLLLADEPEPVWLEGPRIHTVHTHGTGCVLSAAICAGLATGMDLVKACRSAKTFVTAAIADAASLGSGPGAVDPAPRRE